MSLKTSDNYTHEWRAIFSLSSILSFRMLGLFMIFPIFAISASQFNYSTPTLVGIALGVYGLTQALLQMPLSMLSDRVGRRPIITFGLIIFGLGSVVCALSHNIYVLILGRALQGAGAIGSTLIAYAADLTRVESRTKAMAILGMTIGASFAIAMVVGPVINTWFHLAGIFWFTVAMAGLGLAILYWKVPKPSQSMQFSPTTSANLKALLFDLDLLRFNIGILLLHAILSATFVVIPILLKETGFLVNDQWQIYFGVMVGAFIIVMLILNVMEKKNLTNPVLIGSILSLCLIEFVFFSTAATKIGIVLALFVFFCAFSVLEATLPSLVSKLAPASQKGTVMGIFSSCQFLGIFLGGTVAGIIHSHYGYKAIFLFCALLAFFWSTLMLTLKPQYCLSISKH